MKNIKCQECGKEVFYAFMEGERFLCERLEFAAEGKFCKHRCKFKDKIRKYACQKDFR